MNPGAYSDLKVGFHLDRIDAMRHGEQIAPVELQLILSDWCPQACQWCAYRADKGLSTELFGITAADGTRNVNPMRMLTRDKASEILGDFRRLGGKAVIFTGGGEPTAHPQHLELFREALDLGLDCAMNTNGAFLKAGWEALLPRFAYVRFSVDAGTEEEYGRTRSVKPHVYRKVLANLEALAKEVARTGSRCTVGSGYIVTPDAWPNLVQGVRNLRETGAHYVRLAAMMSTDGVAPYEGKWDLVKAEIAKARELETEAFRVYDLFGDRIQDLVQHSPDYESCRFQQMVVYIGADRHVYRCCSTAYTLHGDIGDLTAQSYAEWFAGEQKRNAYGDFDARSCSFCQWNGRNRVINALVDEPVHPNFV